LTIIYLYYLAVTLPSLGEEGIRQKTIYVVGIGNREVRNKQSEHIERQLEIVQHSVTVAAHIGVMSPPDV
jgi:hypothetical protein